MNELFVSFSYDMVAIEKKWIIELEAITQGYYKWTLKK